MRIHNILFLVVFVLICSCNKTSVDDEILLQEKKRSLPTYQLSEASNNISEEVLYMTSFLIAKTLLESSEARSDFQNALDNSNKGYFNFSELLNANLVDDTSFEIEFHNQYAKYNFQMDEIGTGVTPPTHTPEPDPIRPGNPGDILSYFYNDYVDILINQNCLQLFFPNKQVLNSYRGLLDNYINASGQIISAWHPMNLDNQGYGLNLFQSGRGSFILFDAKVAQKPTFCMVLRPENNDECFYGEVDFTIFPFY